MEYSPSEARSSFHGPWWFNTLCSSRFSQQCPWIQVFWDIAPCRLLNSYQRRRAAFFLHLEIPTWTLKTKSESASETSVTIYQSKQHYIAEDLNVHYLVFKRLPHVPIKIYFNVLHKLTPCFFNTPFKIANSCTTTSSLLSCLLQWNFKCTWNRAQPWHLIKYLSEESLKCDIVW
jgi:hypothetical protein